MTEPGENTTVFTMFGSVIEKHEWLIVKIDLKHAFSKYHKLFKIYIYYLIKIYIILILKLLKLIFLTSFDYKIILNCCIFNHTIILVY